MNEASTQSVHRARTLLSLLGHEDARIDEYLDSVKAAEPVTFLEHASMKEIETDFNTFWNVHVEEE